MRTDDEILDRARVRATAIRRRHRLVTGGAAALVAVVLLAGGVALAAGDAPDGPTTADGGRATTTEAPPTSSTRPPATTADDGATTTTASTAPSEPTTTTAAEPSATTTAPDGPAPTTTPPAPTTVAEQPSTTTTPGRDPIDDPPDPVTPQPWVVQRSAAADGLTVDVTASGGGDPGDRTVTVTVRLRTARGSGPGGTAMWAEGDPTAFGHEHASGCGVGSFPRPPDPGAGPVDQTFTVTRAHAAGTHQLAVVAWTSQCYADRATTRVDLAVTVP